LKLSSVWDLRIARASELKEKHSAAAELLKFYEQLARFQKSLYERLADVEDHDVAVLIRFIPDLVALVKQAGSAQLKEAATSISQASREDLLELMNAVWEHSLGIEQMGAEYAFFAKALLQPYAEMLAKKATSVQENISNPRCPFCGSKPQVAVLRPEGDGGKRSLVCSLCATEWTFRRLMCPSCGEEHKDKLPVFVADGLEYVRVEACDNCHKYIKSIDMTKNGRAVPLVDELATVSLNLWAQEKNYQKLEANLFGV
jgi:FdhE protein